MIILLDTSTNICKLNMIDGNDDKLVQWQADRNLARDLLKFIVDNLELEGKKIKDISGIGIFRGPGSFTGLRIGMTVANVIAHELKIPIIGETGENWQEKIKKRLLANENDKIVLPFYGAEANITKPRK